MRFGHSPNENGTKNSANADVRNLCKSNLLRGRRLRRDLGEFAEAVLVGGRVDLVELDLAGEDLAFPVLVGGLHGVEFGHDLGREKFEAFADVFVGVVAGLIEENDLVDVRGRELAEFLGDRLR